MTITPTGGSATKLYIGKFYRELREMELREYFEIEKARIVSEHIAVPIAELEAAKLTVLYADKHGISEEDRKKAFSDYPEIQDCPDPVLRTRTIKRHGKFVTEVVENRVLRGQWVKDLNYRHFVRSTITRMPEKSPPQILEKDPSPKPGSDAKINRADFPTIAAVVDEARRCFGDSQVSVVYAEEGGKMAGKKPTTRTHEVLTEYDPRQRR